MLVHTLRLQRGWSQEQLADLSGLSVRTIQRIERGGGASVESLKALAAVFEVDFHQLRQEVDVSDAPRSTLASAVVGPRPAASDPPVATSSADLPVAAPSANDPRTAALPADEALILAQVRRIRGFYGHLARYAVIVAGLAIVGAIRHAWHGSTFWWVLWVAGGWGLGLIAHGLRAFELLPFLGADWERRQVEKRLERSL